MGTPAVLYTASSARRPVPFSPRRGLQMPDWQIVETIARRVRLAEVPFAPVVCTVFIGAFLLVYYGAQKKRQEFLSMSSGARNLRPPQRFVNFAVSSCCMSSATDGIFGGSRLCGVNSPLVSRITDCGSFPNAVRYSTRFITLDRDMYNLGWYASS